MVVCRDFKTNEVDNIENCVGERGSACCKMLRARRIQTNLVGRLFFDLQVLRTDHSAPNKQRNLQKVKKEENVLMTINGPSK